MKEEAKNIGMVEGKKVFVMDYLLAMKSRKTEPRCSGNKEGGFTFEEEISQLKNDGLTSSSMIKKTLSLLNKETHVFTKPCRIYGMGNLSMISNLYSNIDMVINKLKALNENPCYGNSKNKGNGSNKEVEFFFD